MNKKLLVFAGIGLILTAILTWAYLESTKPLPGKEEFWDERTHLEQGEHIDYKSNPPTSGPHYPEPLKAGIYNDPQNDGNLVHSLEHGYVIISYNCDKKVTSNESQKPSFSIIKESLAHGTEEEHATESATIATASASLSDNFKSDDCKVLVDELTKIYNEKDMWKLIVVPRPLLDTKIALTAWGRIDKFDSFDRNRIINFIDKLRDKGPEKTME